jgi:autotransporter-associated beta strand protein
MSKLKYFVFTSLAVLVAAMQTAMVNAAELTWDADTVTFGPQDGSGAWDTAGNTNWWNGSANVQWNNGDSAIVGANTGATGVINLSSTIQLAGLRFDPIGSTTLDLYQVQGGELAFANNSTIKANQIRGGGPTFQRSRIASNISGSNLTFGSDIVSPPTVNDVGFLDITGANTHTGTVTVGGSTTVFFTSAAALNHDGVGADISSLSITPGATVDLNYSGPMSVPITINSMGAANGSTIGILPTHAVPGTNNAGALRIGGSNATVTFTSTVTLAGDSEIQAAAGGTLALPNIVNLNTNLTSAHHLTLRANQGSQLHINNPVTAASVGLRITQSASGGGGVMTVNQAINASDLFVFTNSNNSQLTVNSPITLSTASGIGKATFLSGGNTSGITAINATIAAPGGIEFQRGLATVNLNSSSGAALNTPEVILAATGGTGNTLLVAKADNQISPNTVLTYSGTGITRTLRLEGHTLTIGGLQTSGVTTASQAVVQNNLASTTGHLIVNDNTDRSFGGVMQNGTGSGSLLAFTKQGSGKLTLDAGNTYTGTTTISGGTLALGPSGGINSSSVIQVDAGATFDVSARLPSYSVGATQTLKGNGTVVGNVNTVAGSIIAPGGSVGTLSINGDTSLISTLAIEYSGATIDKLTVSGALDITTATVDFNQLATLAGGARVFASYGSLVGAAFASVLDLPAGFTINYNYLGANQIALVGGAHPGDFDSDGDVDGADFVAWQTNFPKASGALPSEGDADGDGDVDGADFVVWQTNFPFTPGPGASPVPEPQAALLVCLGAVGMLIACRKRQKLVRATIC